MQPPLFDKEAEDAANFGAVGAVIGHELTHGFDDEGRKFDANGNLRDWWTAEDNKEFEGRAKCIADEYSSFEATPGTKLNGNLTLGENTADNGGTRIALMALQKTLAASGKSSEIVDGFNPEQRFIAYGQAWCSSWTPQFLRLWHSRIHTRHHNIASMAWCSICRNFRRLLTAKKDSPW